MKTFLSAGLLLATAMTPWSMTWGAEWKISLPKEPVVKLYTEKSEYRSGEPVQFMLFKHRFVSDSHATAMASVTVVGANIAKVTPETSGNTHLAGPVGLANAVPDSLTDSYYIIQRKMDNGQWREFYTSQREPFGKSLQHQSGFVWRWDHLDNEGTHRAKPGQWRLVFHAPKIHVASKEGAGAQWAVHFEIRGAEAKQTGPKQGSAEQHSSKPTGAKQGSAEQHSSKPTGGKKSKSTQGGEKRGN